MTLYRVGLASMAACAGVWAGSVGAQTIDFGQRLPNSSFVTPPGLDSSVPLTVQSVGSPADVSTLSNTAGLGQYIVYVNGESDLLLQQIRRVEPGAFRRSYNDRQVIQAGRFLTLANAQERVTELENRGILAEVANLGNVSNPSVGGTSGGISSSVGGATIPSTFPGTLSGTLSPSSITPIPLDTAPLPVNTTLDFAAPNPNPSAFSPNLVFGQNQAYYVAIPSRPGDLATLANQLAATGINPSLILARAARRGAFIALGPYSDRLSAEVMVASLKGAGFGNARVYYGY